MKAFYDELTFIHHAHLPKCAAQIDKSFDYCALNFASSGRIHWSIEGSKRITLPAPLAWWTWQGPRFRYGSIEHETWDHRYVTFTGNRTKLMANSLVTFSSNRAFASVQNASEYRHAWERLFDILDSPSGSVQRAVNALDALFLMLENPVKPAEAENPSLLKVRDLVTRIEQNSTQEWDWEQEAMRLSMTAVYMRRLFKKLTGCPPHQYLLNLRLLKVSQDLRDSGRSIKEISHEHGFENTFYLSRIFKKRYGLSPQHYRNQCLRTIQKN